MLLTDSPLPPRTGEVSATSELRATCDAQWCLSVAQCCVPHGALMSVCLSVQMEVSELMSQLVQQTEYCSSMGAACCTLLWRVSQQEEVVPSIIGGVGPQAEILHIRTYVHM